MAFKSKVKPKTQPKKSKASSTAKKAVVKMKVVQKKAEAKPDTKIQPAKKAEQGKAPAKAAERKTTAAKAPIVAIVKRVVNPLLERRRPIKKHSTRGNQFNFMKAPGSEHAFDVGDTVEVFCDHEKNRDRIRGWVKGIVVQVDHKLAAVQFRSNVYLTDGWMVPDRILWFPVNSEHIRPLAGKKQAEKKEFIPDY